MKKIIYILLSLMFFIMTGFTQNNLNNELLYNDEFEQDFNRLQNSLYSNQFLSGENIIITEGLSDECGTKFTVNLKKPIVNLKLFPFTYNETKTQDRIDASLDVRQKIFETRRMKPTLDDEYQNIYLASYHALKNETIRLNELLADDSTIINYIFYKSEGNLIPVMEYGSSGRFLRSSTDSIQSDLLNNYFNRPSVRQSLINSPLDLHKTNAILLYQFSFTKGFSILLYDDNYEFIICKDDEFYKTAHYYEMREPYLDEPVEKTYNKDTLYTVKEFAEGYIIREELYWDMMYKANGKKRGEGFITVYFGNDQ